MRAENNVYVYIFFLFRLAGVCTYTYCVRTLNIEFVNVFFKVFHFKRGYMLGVLCFYPIQSTTFINTCQWISIKHMYMYINKSIQTYIHVR